MTAAEIYSDINKYSPTAAQSRVVNVDAVFAAVHNFFNTSPKRRLFRPEGFTFDPLLWEPNNDAAIFATKSIIARILAAEPRIFLLYNQTEIRPDPENHALHIKLRFQVRGLGNQIFERAGTLRRDTL